MDTSHWAIVCDHKLLTHTSSCIPDLSDNQETEKQWFVTCYACPIALGNLSEDHHTKKKKKRKREAHDSWTILPALPLLRRMNESRGNLENNYYAPNSSICIRFVSQQILSGTDGIFLESDCSYSNVFLMS